MIKKDSIKIAFIGAGSFFCQYIMNDLFLDELCDAVKVELCLMDISKKNLELSKNYAVEASALLNKDVTVTSTIEMEKAVDGADFVITAFAVKRYYYWSMDFHIPRRYGSAQVYGENGGPGSMFHFMRNIDPMLNVVRAMERLCPDAWLINLTNPEAKMVDAMGRLTKIKAVGLCHGIVEGQQLISEITGVCEDDLDVAACGLNHFGWYQKIQDKKMGNDLYPLLKEKELKADWLAKWDGFAFPRMLLRTYGLLPYPVTNHIAEYIRWGDRFIASPNMQYFYDPVSEDPWSTGKVPEKVYFADGFTDRTYFSGGYLSEEEEMAKRFAVNKEDIKSSGEYVIPIIKGLTLNAETRLLTVNRINNGKIPGLPDDMAVELPAIVNADGIHTEQMQPLPDAITEMIRLQGTINKMLTEAYLEKSRNKLLQAMLLDPTSPPYHNAVALINEMCERQKEILPELLW